MRGSRHGTVLAAALVAALAACSGTAVHDANPSAPATGIGAAGAQNGDLEAGAAGTAEPAGAAGAAGAGATDDACEQKHDATPGPALVELSSKGSGACAGTTLADAIARARALRPDLADVSALYDPNSELGGDGSFIYAFAEADGGFALAFKRGGGDCPSGCTENDYWYFETGAACTVSQVGESHRVANDGGLGSCVPPDQLPRWGVPAAAAPRDICGADNSPVQLSGSYEIVTCGTDSGCTLGGDQVSLRTLPSLLSLKIEQDPADLSIGTVTLDGTGEALLDAQPLPANFARRSFEVDVVHSPSPSACVDTWRLDFSYDFEGFGTRHMTFFQTHAPDCTNAPNAYCKGQLSADLGEAHPHE